MLTFNSKKMCLYYLYNIFFDTMRKLGNMPYIFREEELQLELLTWRNNYYKFWLFNTCVCIAYWFKHVILLIRCHFLNYAIPDYELIVFWFAGSSTFLLYSLNVLLCKEEMAVVVSACTKFEKWMRDNYDLVISVKHRRIVWYVFILFAVGAAGVPLLVTCMYWAKPRLPQFLYSMLPIELDEDPDWWFWGLVIKVVIFIFELYTPYLACANVFAVDLIAGLISVNVMSSMKRVLAREGITNVGKESVTSRRTPPPIRGYKMMSLLSNRLNIAYSQLIGGMEFVTLLMFVYATYILISSPSILIKLFFVFIMIFEVAHAAATFLPLALLYLRSRQFCGTLRGRFESSKHSRLELKSCQVFAIKPAGTHTVTHLTIMGLILGFVEHLQLLFNI